MTQKHLFNVNSLAELLIYHSKNTPASGIRYLSNPISNDFNG